MISTLATLYLFLGGTGAASLVLFCCLEMTCALGDSVGFRNLAPDFSMRAWVACAFTLLLAIVCLAFDLGRLGDVWKLFLFPQPTPLVVGAYALTVAVACACFFAAVHVFDDVCPRRCVVVGFACVGVFSGLVVMVYTGVLLKGMPSVVAWQTPLLPVLFALSSASCGAASTLAVAAFSEDCLYVKKIVPFLTCLDSVLIACEAVVLFLFVAFLFGDERSITAATSLTTGSMAPQFWMGVVGAGVVAPLALERFSIFSDMRIQMIVIASLVLFGGFMLRWCVVDMAALDPSQAYVAASYAAPSWTAM